MSYGGNGFAVMEQGNAPRCHEKNRPCGRCEAGRVNRYAKPVRVGAGRNLLLCADCRVEMKSNDERLAPAKPGTPAGVELPGLAKARRAAGLSQSTLAAKVGRTFGAVSNVERGATKASRAFADELAVALNLPVRALTEGGEGAE